MSPSYHHAYLSSRIIAVLSEFKDYSIFSELTLRIEDKNYVPNISLYKKRKINFKSGDILQMTEMPLLAIEILSPSQGTQEIVEKFHLYFQAGIKSCWLVIPLTESITVYSSPDNAETFYKDKILDKQLTIEFPINKIFDN